jgi:low affinity Fe/Cu permease
MRVGTLDANRPSDMGELHHHHRSSLKRGNVRQRMLREQQSKRVARLDRRAHRQHEAHRLHIMRARNDVSSRSGLFRRFAQSVSVAAGRPWTFALAVAVIVAWGISGPIFGFSDTWQLVINTGTTIVTFLMVFLIQNTQNRDTEALRLKLDELILATNAARNEFVRVEDLDDQDLQRLEEDLKAVCHSGGDGDEDREGQAAKQ